MVWIDFKITFKWCNSDIDIYILILRQVESSPIVVLNLYDVNNDGWILFGVKKVKLYEIRDDYRFP